MTMTITRKLADCLRWASRRSALKQQPTPAITLAELERLWWKQDGRCALTGVALEMKGPNGVTLDRKKPGAVLYAPQRPVGD
jgi:hypothetical protein